MATSNQNNPFSHLQSPPMFKCALCGKNYFAYNESLNKQCNFCSGILARMVGGDEEAATVSDRILGGAFEGDPPWLTDPSISIEGPPPPGTMPPASMPPGYPRKAYTQEDSPNVARNQWGDVTDYWNGQYWVHITQNGEEQ